LEELLGFPRSRGVMDLGDMLGDGTRVRSPPTGSICFAGGAAMAFCLRELLALALPDCVALQ
jgi:hypothetical protein